VQGSTPARRRASARLVGSACIPVVASPALPRAVCRPLTISATAWTGRPSSAGPPQPAVAARRLQKSPSRSHPSTDTEVPSMASSSVTRRSLLKRAGVGAAVVGAGSIVTATTAGAAAHPHAATCVHAGGCGPFLDCHSAPHQCCGCVITVEGCCFCMENVFCAGLHACHTSTQCPPGWACATGGCLADPGFCVPPCGTGDPNHAPCSITAASGATWNGGGGQGGGGHHHEEPAAPDPPPHRPHGHG
jgi:hypothetical protein